MPSPGHWEGDLIIGLDRSAIGTLVERTTRFTMLPHGRVRRRAACEKRPGTGRSRRRDDHQPAGSTAADTDWDRGKELAQHAQLTADTGVQVYFADPHSPWQRGTNENTICLLRQRFLKGTALARWNRDDLDAIAATLNKRPRKTLGWKTPAEAMNEQLLAIQSTGDATTG
ncbi:IS30 family transposase [Polymorphospora sp. NPDC050346]|uniref:IS30 family transposase n=1 Tax=Polymorphospora sp. NPDC050346 TaxID=3155780 RepID=UPI0033C4462F